MTRDDRNRRRRATTFRTGPTTAGGAGQVSAQRGSDGTDVAIGVGDGLTVDSGGTRVGPGMSVDVAPACAPAPQPEPPSAPADPGC